MTHYVWIVSQIRSAYETYWPMAEYLGKISPWVKGGELLERAWFALWTDWRSK